MPVNNWIPVATQFTQFLGQNLDRRKKLQAEVIAQQIPTFIGKQMEGLNDELDVLNAIPKISAQLYQFGPEVGQFGSQVLGQVADLKMKGITYKKDQKSKQEFLIKMNQQFGDRPLNIGGQVVPFGQYFEKNKLEILANPDLYSKTIPALLSEAILQEKSTVGKGPAGGYTVTSGYMDKTGKMMGQGITHNIYEYKSKGKQGYYKEMDEEKGFTAGDQSLTPDEMQQFMGLKESEERLKLAEYNTYQNDRMQRVDVYKDGKPTSVLYNPKTGMYLNPTTKEVLPDQDKLVRYTSYGQSMANEKRADIQYTYKAGEVLSQVDLEKLGEDLPDDVVQDLRIIQGYKISRSGPLQIDPGTIIKIYNALKSKKKLNTEQEAVRRQIIKLNEGFDTIYNYDAGGIRTGSKNPLEEADTKKRLDEAYKRAEGI